MISVYLLIALCSMVRGEIKLSIGQLSGQFAVPMTFEDDATVNDVREKIKEMGLNKELPFFLFHHRTGTKLANKDAALMHVCNHLGMYVGDTLDMVFPDVRDLRREYSASQIEEIVNYVEKEQSDSGKAVYFLVRTNSDKANVKYEYNYVSRNADNAHRLYTGEVPQRVQKYYRFIGNCELYECAVCMEMKSKCSNNALFRENMGFLCPHVGQVCVDCWLQMWDQQGPDNVKCPLCRMSKEEQMRIDDEQMGRARFPLN